MKTEDKIGSPAWGILLFQVLAVVWVAYLVGHYLWPWFIGVVPGAK